MGEYDRPAVHDESGITTNRQKGEGEEGRELGVPEQASEGLEWSLLEHLRSPMGLALRPETEPSHQDREGAHISCLGGRGNGSRAVLRGNGCFLAWRGSQGGLFGGLDLSGLGCFFRLN